MSATTMHQSRVAKVHMPLDTAYQPSSNARSSSSYKTTIEVVTQGRDQPMSNVSRRRRPDSEASYPPSSLHNIVSYNQSHSQRQSTARYSQSINPVTVPLQTATNRRASVASNGSTYSSLITFNHPSANSTLDSAADVSSQKKHCPNDPTKPLITSTKVSNHVNIIPKVKASHSSYPGSYQQQISLNAITTSSDPNSSFDNTSLHHLPESNETTDKSQQSVNFDGLNHSPRKVNNHHTASSRLASVSSIDDPKRMRTPSIHYTIEPIEVQDDLHSENHLDSKQKAIREEKKRKANENEQVLINVDEYAPEILNHLKEREYTSRPKPNYMRKQTELTWDMRAILIDWLSEVADEYKLYSETLHLAVNFIDRFLSRMSVTKSKFQLIGTTALYLAAKCEEVYPPNASEFAYVTDNAYTKKQVLKIEDLLLQTLHFEVSTVTTHTFLLHYFKLAEVDDITEDLARYIAELTLLDPDCLQYSSSLQAAAILCLALHMCHKPPWSNTLKQTTGYSIRSFYSIMEKFLWLLAKAHVHDKWAITRKYRQVKHHGVASIELPTTLPYVDIENDAIL